MTAFIVARSWSVSRTKGVRIARLRGKLGHGLGRLAGAVAAVGDEGDKGLAREVVRRQEGPHRGGQCHPPDREAEEHGPVSADVGHPFRERRGGRGVALALCPGDGLLVVGGIGLGGADFEEIGVEARWSCPAITRVLPLRERKATSVRPSPAPWPAAGAAARLAARTGRMSDGNVARRVIWVRQACILQDDRAHAVEIVGMIAEISRDDPHGLMQGVHECRKRLPGGD